MATRHRVEKLIDAIEGVTPTEKAVLRALVAHGDWETGEGCYPKVETLQKVTGLSRRTVQYTLRSLSCPSPASHDDSLTGAHRCRHRGLLVITAAATRYRATTYRVRIELLEPRQLHLPEISGRSGRTVPGSPPRRSDRPPLCLVCDEPNANRAMPVHGHCVAAYRKMRRGA